MNIKYVGNGNDVKYYTITHKANPIIKPKKLTIS